MAKRKSTKSKMAPRKTKAAKLETTFSCPFCNHADSVECTFDRKLRIAQASCRVCNETYATVCHALTEPIDVYGEWIDACEQANDAIDLRRAHRDEDDYDRSIPID